MRKLLLTTLAGVALLLSSEMTATHISVSVAALLVSVYLVKANSFMSLMILLEFLVMNVVIFLLVANPSLAFDYWNLFSVLVFSAVEASLGLSLLVFLARGWGSSLKIAGFK